MKGTYSWTKTLSTFSKHYGNAQLEVPFQPLIENGLPLRYRTTLEELVSIFPSGLLL